MLNQDTLTTIVTHAPLVSIDLVIQNPFGEFLLGYRVNRPAQHSWFVPGGRVFKDETLDQAFERISQAELGVLLARSETQFLGVYEHFYPDAYIDETLSTHYIPLGYYLALDIELAKLPKEQHAHYKWFSADELLKSPDVHTHTKWYIEAVLAQQA